MSAGDESTGPGLVRRRTDEIGLHFLHDAGSTEGLPLPEIVGSGVRRVVDFNTTAWLDIYPPAKRGSEIDAENRLFHRCRRTRSTDVVPARGLDTRLQHGRRRRRREQRRLADLL